MRAVQMLSLVALLALIPFSISAQTPVRALSTTPHTNISHTLKFGLSNLVCDSVRSAQQCFEFLLQRDEAKAPIFLKLSTTNLKEAIEDIEEIMNGRVDLSRERMRWEAIQELAIVARQVVTNLNDPRSANVPERAMPQSLKNLHALRGISRIEVVHRFLISGDRLLVDHQMIDRSATDEAKRKLIATASAHELSPDALSASFGKDISRSAKLMGEDLLLGNDLLTSKKSVAAKAPRK